MKKRLVFLAPLLLCCAVAAGQAAPGSSATKTPRSATNVETRITADQLTYTAEKQRVVFERQVHVQRPDFQLWANRLTVYLKPAKAGAPKKESGGMPEGMATGDVDKLVAEGSVRMESDGRKGTCAKATYMVDTGVLLMEGDPRLTDGENTVTGETIKYFTEQNRSEVMGGTKKRVEAVFSGNNGKSKSDAVTPKVSKENR